MIPVPPVPAAPPTLRQVERAAARARAGKALDAAEATVLLHARGEHLAALAEPAGRVRDEAMARAGRPGTVTYSRKVFVPLTRLCRDRCHYCTFVTVPHRLPAAFLEMEEVLDIARAGASAGCKEALFTLGDRPEDRWPQARQWLDERGYDDTLSYVRACAVAVLEETGLLPHLNPGVMSWQEIQRLKPVAPSMGMMLETTATRLWSEPSGPHYGSPDKEPALRLRVLEDAGRLAVPFTTGILVGIGETPAERVDSLLAIRRVSRELGSVQEVIVQNFRAKPDTAMRSAADMDAEGYLATLAVARLLLGPTVSLQAPPNLSEGEDLAALLGAGVDDWGGVSPVTPDHVNPERPWPHLDDLTRRTGEAGFRLAERLTIHPSYVRAALGEAPGWLDVRLRAHVAALADPVSGLAAAGAVAAPLPWQEPDGGLVTSGRADLHAAVDTTGRNADRRGDFDDVYGDWTAVGERRHAEAPAVLGTDEVSVALRRAAEDPAGLGDAAYLALLTCDGDQLEALAGLADDVRRDTVGDDVTYVVNRNINVTNVCYVGCRFCAFAQRATDPDAYTLSLAEVGRRAAEAQALGATEVCIQSGISPDLGPAAYAGIVRAVLRAAPGMHVHAFSPMEIVSAAARAGTSVADWLTEVRDAGLGSIPGTAAEILDDDVRWVLTKGKLPAGAWVEVVETAHRLGIPSSSTMMYGHVDHPRHWVAHLRTLASVQDRTGGFTEFVPLPFVHHSSPIYLAGLARPGPTLRDNRAVHAVARLLLHGRIDNIQTSWVKLGVEGTRAMLTGGANDLGGTLMEETISRMAGSVHGSAKTVEELHQIAAGIGRPVRQRSTTYAQAPKVA